MRFRWLQKTLAIALLVGGVSSGWAQTLRWGSQADFATADPHSQNDGLNNAIMRHVYEGLVGSNAKLELVPALATEWAQVSPTLWRFKLRPGVKFHNGAAFSADDVVFSVERAQDASSAFRTYAAALGTPRKVDDLTVEFELPKVNPLFLHHLMLVAIMNKAWAAQHNSAKPLDMKNKEERYAGRNANGTGPFILGTRQPDTRTMFTRNPNWWGTFEGNVQEVVYVPVKGDSTRVAALLSGGLDFVLDPAPQDIGRLSTGVATKVLSGPENRVIFLGMDQARDELLYSNVKGKNPFKDLRVRQALYQAIDIETIKSRIMRGQAEPTGVVMSSKAGVFNDAALEKRLPYDVAKARALLTQAGYPDGFQVTLDCPNNRYINDEGICNALAAMWARIGVQVRVNAMPRATYFPKMEKLDTSMYLLGWGGDITDAETTLTPLMRTRGEKGVGAYNWGNFSNPKLDAAAAASSVEPNPTKRAQLIRTAMTEHTEQVHHIPLHRQVIPWAMRSNVTAVHRPDNRLDWTRVKISEAAK